jgi:radical SAM superfamily enzyme YgiQ (UPF0313 family)
MVPFAGIFGFDLVGEQADLVSLGFGEIGLVGFLEEKEEVDDVVFRENEVNDPCSSAFPSIAQGHPDFAKPVATHEQISVFRIGQQFPLKCAVVFITYGIDDLCREKRRFDESELHGK